jgi:hypothetical protein
MSNQHHTCRSLLHRLGVVGPARVRAFPGSGAFRGGDRVSPAWPTGHLRCALALALLCAVTAALTFGSPVAQAATTRKLLTQITEIPATGPASEPVPDPGPLEEQTGMTVDAGQLWLSESSRVDRFEAANGKFVSQFAHKSVGEERGAPYYEGIAIGHAKGEPEAQVYLAKYAFTNTPPFVDGDKVIVDSESGVTQATWPEREPGLFPASKCSLAVDNSGSLSDWAAGDLYVSCPGPSKGQTYVIRREAGGKEHYVTALPEPALLPGYVALPGPVAVSESTGDVFVAYEEEGAIPATVSKPFAVVNEYEPTLLGEYRLLREIKGTPAGPFPEQPIKEGQPVPEGIQIRALAVEGGVGGSGDLYVAPKSAASAGVPSVVDQFGPEGEYLGQLTGTPAGPFGAVQGLAVDPASGDLYVGDRGASSSVVDVFGPTLVLPDVTTSPAKAVGLRRATLAGTVDPDGAGAATCRFEWGTSEAFGHLAPCEPEAVANATKAEAVHAELTGLQPDTTYYYRLQAGNANGTNPGEVFQDHSFTTLGPPTVEEPSASGVTSTSATLNAGIDPNRSATNYYFQYSTTGTEGCTPSTCTSVPVPPGASAGSGAEALSVSVHLQGLSPGTVYHYRIVASSEPEGEAFTVQSPDETFTTQGPGSGTSLPDGRSYEMVTPPNKHGAGIYPIGREDGTDIQAAAGGDGITFAATAPFATNPQGSRSIETTQVLSTRGGSDWETADISTPHNEGASSVQVDPSTEYFLFSSDLSLGIVEPKGDTPLPPLPAGSEKTVYARHDGQCVATPAVPIPATCYQALVSAANVPEGTEFGGSKESQGGVAFVSASPDLGHVVLKTVPLTAEKLAPSLTETAVPQGGLYEFTAGRPVSEPLQLVSILPPHEGKLEEPATGVLLGYRGHDVRHAISNDGSRVFFTGGESVGGESNKSTLYMRDLTRKETIEIGGAGAVFEDANAEGSRVFFTEGRHEEHGAVIRGDLYVFEVTSGASEPATGRVTPLSTGAEVQGVIGASEDGSYVYFVANGVLGDGAAHGATPGDCEHENARRQEANETCSLYVEHYDEATRAWEAPQFIAALAIGDSHSWGRESGRDPGEPGEGNLSSMTSRVSPNGRWLAFMSERSLTGYDNRDVNGGERDEEVFEYHAPEGLEGDAGSHPPSLVCVSCDPTGARPLGLFDYDRTAAGAYVGGPLVDYGEVWAQGSGRWLAANIPQWTPASGFAALYQSRYLSDSGRLFFDSSDGLVPADVNGKEDVYEYEPQGVPVGSPYACSPASTDGSDAFEPAKKYQTAAGEDESGAGCVALISSGTSSEESAFLDASESGGDVFFMTSSKLVPADYDTSYDIYDAHECTSEAPCAPSEKVPPPPCETESSCKAAPSPQPEVYGAPSSMTFSGAGNITPAVAPPPKIVMKKTVKCKKGHVKKRGVCVKEKSKSARKSKQARKTNRRAK